MDTSRNINTSSNPSKKAALFFLSCCLEVKANPAKAMDVYNPTLRSDVWKYISGLKLSLTILVLVAADISDIMLYYICLKIFFVYHVQESYA